MKRRRLKTDFLDTVARTGTSITDFANLAGVERGTIYALINPEQHPHRKGGMHRATAWKLARTYATLAKVDDDTAYARLIVEEQIEENAA